MYLIPRIIGVGTYALLLFLVYYLIRRVKGLSIQLNIYTIALALMGFFYVPMGGSDLTRIIPTMHAYANLVITEAESWTIIMSTGTPIATLYYHFIGNLGDDRWLPFINAFLTFGLCFALLKAIYKKMEVSKKDIALVFLFFMSRGLLMMTIANIRTMLSMSIIAYCIYKILIERKKIINYFPWLIVASLVHTAGMAAVMIFVTYYILKGNVGKYRVFANFGILSLVFVVYIYGSAYIQAAITKGSNYLRESQASTGYFYIWEFFLSLIIIFITLHVLCFYYFKINRINKKDVCKIEKTTSGRFVGFMAFLTLIDLFAILIEFNVGLRLSWLVTILDMPLLLIIFTSRCYSNKYKLKEIVFFVSLILLLIASARGDLCSLKFV